MPEVRCSVSNCTHWGQGNFCQASAIIVQPDNNMFTNISGDSYQSALLAGQQMSSTALASDETCCQTFEPKY
ncbi:DUF1540 domain-containing protein [Bacillus sp. 165]|uniref:DUF1540 domain-containing protein n=1 Tax=Bacillus sp. 165 TaxID=1529117 RepID=UPI001ADC2B07|nr:DUF1540 domain-containing protein [Bacillus sp. 165]MBO9128826.1 DUF1540 domain-containing protein [Bacillus sp. 165]